MKTLENKLIIYDSNCKVCSSMRGVILKLTSIPEAKVKAYKDLPVNLSSKVDPSMFKNVMAVIDTSGEKTLYGTEGVAYIFSSQYKLVDWLLSFNFIYKLFGFFYKTTAYNRYIIAQPKSKFQCDCFPDNVYKYRMAYILCTTSISVLLTLLYGISLKRFIPGLSSSEAAVQMLLIVGTGWVMQILLSILLMKKQSLEYLGHLGSIMVVGLLIQIPWIVFSFTTETTNVYIPLFSVAASSWYMLYLHIVRVKYLQLSQLWTASWFILLQLFAGIWVYYFYLR